MIIKTSIYFDDKDLSAKEACYSATDAIKHKPDVKGGYEYETVLPNGKSVSVAVNETLTQIRVGKL